MTALPWRLKYWNGSAWSDAELRRWTGSSWTVTNGYYWDGSSWVLLTDRTPPTAAYVSQYPSVWHQSYQQSGAQRSDSNGNTYNYQGNSGSSPYGRQKSMWGLSSDVFDDLQGSVAHYSARTWLDNVYTWYNAGGTAVIGTHISLSKPGTFQVNRPHIGTVYFSRGQAAWLDWGGILLDWAKEGSLYGFTLSTDSNDVQYYGYWSGSMIYEQTYEK